MCGSNRNKNQPGRDFAFDPAATACSPVLSDVVQHHSRKKGHSLPWPSGAGPIVVRRLASSRRICKNVLVLAMFATLPTACRLERPRSDGLHASHRANAHKRPHMAENAGMIELLQDPALENGVRPPSNGSNVEGPGSTCLERWKQALPSTATTSWRFVTVAETTRFCDNPETPSVQGATIVYSSKNGAKRFEINCIRREIRYVFDTEQEWRHGCNLSLPQNGTEPQYLSSCKWNWPHFLLCQDIKDPNAPDGKLRLSDYTQATLLFQAELLESEKGLPEQCPPGTWGDQHIPDHCLFYTALVLVRQESARPAAAERPKPARIYAVFPLFYSTTGDRHDDTRGPWLGMDPAGDAVYLAPNHNGLEVGNPVDVSIDAHALVAESIDAINERCDAALSADEYYVESILIGWEVWGAYRSDLRLRNLSFQASPKTPR